MEMKTFTLADLNTDINALRAVVSVQCFTIEYREVDITLAVTTASDSKYNFQLHDGDDSDFFAYMHGEESGIEDFLVRPGHITFDRRAPRNGYVGFGVHRGEIIVLDEQRHVYMRTSAVMQLRKLYPFAV